MPFFADAARLPAEDALASATQKPRADGAVTIAVPMLPRIANFDDFDPLRMEPDVRLVFVAPGRAAAGRRSRHPARHQGDDRRPRLLSRAGLGHRSSRPRAARRASARHLRRLSDARRQHRRSARHRGAGGEVEGLGLLDVETTLTGDKTLRRSGRVRRERRAVLGLRDACRRDQRPGLRPAAAALRRRTARRRDVGGRPRSSAPMCTGSSPTTASAQPGSPRSARPRSSPMRRQSSGRSMRSPTISRPISISTVFSALRDDGALWDLPRAR